jgi:RNA recognition motif-containing protein
LEDTKSTLQFAAHAKAIQLRPNVNQEIAVVSDVCTLYVQNLPYGVEEGEIVDHFVVFGAIESVAMPKHNGRFCGFAFVKFKSPDAVDLAVRNGSSSLGGRVLTVRRCYSRKRNREEEEERPSKRQK